MALNGVLLVLMAAAIASIQLFDRSGAAVEASVRRYAMAISNSDLDAAMAEIAPERRADSIEFVQSQLGNIYDVTGIAVRSASVLARPFEVTAIMDVNRNFPEDFYQPTARVNVEEVDGRWYLAAPLLARP